MRILGIETSCDETAAAVVELIMPSGQQPTQASAVCRLLSNVVLSSMDLHKAYGGVVPEIAARSHIEAIMPVIDTALRVAFQGGSLATAWGQIDGIAVTQGAGLGGSLLVGVLTARTLAIIKNKPLYACNHVEGHIYANFLTEVADNLQLTGYGYELPKNPPEFPMLGLIVSGGHSQLVIWQDHFNYKLLGQTHDDAIGEAFDKVAKIAGLPYPGGPSIEKAALKGNPYAYNFPKARLAGQYDFSFSGLKTAVLRAAQAAIGEDFTFLSSKLPERLSTRQKADLCASFQRIAMETVADKTILAYEEFRPASVVIGGGVASSQALRDELSKRLPCPINYTDRRLCTDNGAMVATLGCFKAILNQSKSDPYMLEIKPNLSM